MKNSFSVEIPRGRLTNMDRQILSMGAKYAKLDKELNTLISIFPERLLHMDDLKPSFDSIADSELHLSRVRLIEKHPDDKMCQGFNVVQSISYRDCQISIMFNSSLTREVLELICLSY